MNNEGIAMYWSRGGDENPMVEYLGEFRLRGPKSLWLPAIPMPLLGLRKKCQCGRKFWTKEGYEAHYVLAHIFEFPGKEIYEQAH